MTHVLGIDIGASRIKSAILDLDAHAVRYRHSCPFPAFIAGTKEVWIDDVATAVQSELARLRSHPVPGDERGVVMCGQMGGFSEGLRFVSWMDKRCRVYDGNSSAIADAVAQYLGVPLLMPAVGDHQCALAGAGLRPGELSINIGTGSQVSMIAPLVAGAWQNRPYFDGQHLRCITHIPAGHALNGLLRLVREMSGMSESNAWEYVVEQVSGRTKTDLRWNLGWFPWDKTSEAELCGITPDNLDAAGMFLAAFDAMARNYHAMAKRLGGERLPLVFSGGLVRRLDKLRERVVEEFGNPSWRMAEDGDETLVGLLTCVLRR